jgi:glycosyltransferase involved in cell wall biosynthesis
MKGVVLMKVAILHYWFLLNGGGERVVSTLLEMFPNADVFCLFADKNSLPDGVNADKVHCSFLESIPFAHKINRALFPFFPAAVGSFDFSGYDLVISSDSPPTKDIVTRPGTIHISYCHTPGRYIWDLAPQFQAELPTLARPLFAAIAAQARISDFVAAQRIDKIVANSRYTQARIRKCYRRESTVIYPPVDTSAGYIASSTSDYYLSTGRLHPAKRIDLLIEACNKMSRRLVIAGTGPEEKRLKAMAGPTVEFVGRVSDQQLRGLYANCRAFLFAAEEDFGIVPIEAQSYGRPVIAYGYGGSLETVRVRDPLGKSDTGIHFGCQSVSSLVEGIKRFEADEHRFISVDIQQHARQFDESVFFGRFSQCVVDVMLPAVTMEDSIEFSTKTSGRVTSDYLADDATAALSFTRR